MKMLINTFKYSIGPWRSPHFVDDEYDCDCGTVFSEEGPVCEVIVGEYGDKFANIKIEGSSIDAVAVPFIDIIPICTVEKNVAINNAKLITSSPTMFEFIKDISDIDNIDVIKTKAKEVLQNILA